MPNQINSTNTPKIYNAGDMHDLASMAECDMDWMSTALSDVQLKVKQIKKDLMARYPNAEYHFSDLEKVLEMFVYLAEDRCRYHEKEAERFREEYEANKKAVTL
ncbi:MULTISPECIES: hypothetical protein [Acinetobacter]|uniref:Uncharacterized protein n=1 Tax=Acinetobacter piscicola TaxID=2006115 RepID=A0A7S6VXD1_9GAMM|nr:MULTISPECIES: hypothetical protein [Acinetobacter]QOW46560.1 hypothetical protein G0028_12015 [Acinetobacter piscicola]